MDNIRAERSWKISFAKLTTNPVEVAQKGSLRRYKY